MMTAGTVPILIAAPFLLIWFGVGRTSAVSLVTFYVVVILYVSAQRAALNLDPIYEHYGLTLGADRRQMLGAILIPGATPEILGGFRIALAGCWGLEAVAELLGSQTGIGKVLEVLAGATDPQGIPANSSGARIGGDPRRCGRDACDRAPHGLARSRRLRSRNCRWPTPIAA